MTYGQQAGAWLALCLVGVVIGAWAILTPDRQGLIAFTGGAMAAFGYIRCARLTREHGR